MDRKVTLDELARMPFPQMHLRKNLPAKPTAHVKDDQGFTILARPNYGCIGPYGPEQQVHWSSILVDVWGNHNHQARTCMPYDLLEAIEQMKAELAAMCPHWHMRELPISECRERGIRHWGTCWHVWECLDCGHVRSHDSSG